MPGEGPLKIDGPGSTAQPGELNAFPTQVESSLQSGVSTWK